jgi:hypothetical protein
VPAGSGRFARSQTVKNNGLRQPRFYGTPIRTPPLHRTQGWGTHSLKGWATRQICVCNRWGVSSGEQLRCDSRSLTMIYYVFAGMMIFMAVLWILILHGTYAKNRWGINRAPLSCPRCATKVSVDREPQSWQQAMCGGWTCMACGIEVDKWGREAAPVGPRHGMAPGQFRFVVLRRLLIVGAPILFCGMLAKGWPTPRQAVFQWNAKEVLWLVGTSVVQTAAATFIMYLYFRHVIKRRSQSAHDSAQSNSPLQPPKV